MTATPQTPADQTVDDALLATDDAPLDTSPYTAEELAGLTDAEREALTAGNPEAEAPEAEAAPQEEAPAAEAAPEPEPEATPAPVAEAPRPDADDLARGKALMEQRASVADEIKALREQYAEGAIESDAFEAQFDALLEKRDGITAQIGAIEGREAARQAAADAQWASACQAFKAEHPDFMDAAHREGFNAEVEAVTGDPRFAALSFERQLELAAKRYAMTPEGEALAAAFAPPAPAPAPAAKAAPAPAPKPAVGAKPDGTVPAKLAAAPVPTLAQLPADTLDPNESEIARISAMIARETDPLKREAMVARLTPDQWEKVATYAG